MCPSRSLFSEVIAKPLGSQLFSRQDLQDLQDFMNDVFLLVLMLILSKGGTSASSETTSHSKAHKHPRLST